ncbi:Carotenoid oxygenase [Dillenia turbinata]|uniref:Carotenoid oxygenase n=1 Tax=Dillenia turbinata TaxID=194707 RepID=A0AAN8UX73_9MAGN
MATLSLALHASGSVQKQTISQSMDLQKLPPTFGASKAIKSASMKMLDFFVDSVFQFVDQPQLPLQENFAPVEEIGEAVQVSCANPLFGGWKSAVSVFGKSHDLWVEGEGMIHAVYFSKDAYGNWTFSYNNRYVDTQTYRLEKQRNKPSLLPAAEGDPPAVLAALTLNMLRYGVPNKHLCNTNVFEHSGKYYAVAENWLPCEIDIFTLHTFHYWDLNGAWRRPFTSHPKVQCNLGLAAYCRHRQGDQRRTNWSDARYGDADSVKWFEVEPNCTFHILNCFEDGHEVVVRGCKAQAAIIPGPDLGLHKFEWFSKGFKFHKSSDESESAGDEGGLFTCVYEWRLNMETIEVKERNLSETELSMDFPMINNDYTGLKHKYGYTQVIDSVASSSCGKSKYRSLAKLYFDEHEHDSTMMKMEYHKLPPNNFFTGATFVAKPGGAEEDDGWILTFVHDENTNVSYVLVVDAKKFEHEPVAKIELSRRVPYGHHGAYFATPSKHIK